MQTPKPISSQITSNLYLYSNPISPYRQRIKDIHSTISSNIKNYSYYISLYKWLSKITTFTSFFCSSYLLFYTLISPQQNIIHPTISPFIASINLSSIFTYIIIQPSQKYILYKESLDGFLSLNQSIDFYLCKHNQDDQENYLTFETCHSKLLKKIDNL